MRRRKRDQVAVKAVKVTLETSSTGAVSEVEDHSSACMFLAALRPIDQRMWRDTATLRPRERRLIIPQGFPDVLQGDRLYFIKESKAFRCTESRMPRQLSKLRIRDDLVASRPAPYRLVLRRTHNAARGLGNQRREPIGLPFRLPSGVGEHPGQHHVGASADSVALASIRITRRSLLRVGKARTGRMGSRRSYRV